MTQPKGTSTSVASRLGRAFHALADTLLATVLLFVFLNAVLWIFWSPQAAPTTPLRVLGVDGLLPAYPGWTADELIRLHTESDLLYDYEPIVEFRLRPVSGKYVNVSAQGFRQGRRALPWPPDPKVTNVFFFGGSTTFGWLLSDAETFPAQMEEQIASRTCRQPVAVYNFGHPAYISTQEALLFQSLLRAGAVPRVAVFFDGFNDFFFNGEMAHTNRLRGLMNGTDSRAQLGAATRLPLYQFTRQFVSRFAQPPQGKPDDRDDKEPQMFQRVIDRWLNNRKLITWLGRQYGTATTFVWQPVAAYKYDLSKHFLQKQELGSDRGRGNTTSTRRAYEAMAARRAELEADQDFLWLADMQEHMNTNLYVDRFHYNAMMSGEIARRILDFLNSKNLLGCEPGRSGTPD